MERKFKTLTDGRKVYWEIVDENGKSLINGTAKNRKKAYAESAHHYRLIDQHRRRQRYDR